MSETFLFVVVYEGTSDGRVYVPLFRSFFTSHGYLNVNVKGIPLRGNFLNRYTESGNLVDPKRINEAIKAKVKKEIPAGALSMIKGIIYITDIDCAFVDIVTNSQNVFVSDHGFRFYDVPNAKIYCKQDYHVSIKREFAPKQESLKKLACMGEMLGCPFRCYFNSINFDHVISNDPNVDSFQKKNDDAQAFSDKNCQSVSSFLSSINSELLGMTHRDSWKWIEQSTNVFQRKTNIDAFFSANLDWDVVFKPYFL